MRSKEKLTQRAFIQAKPTTVRVPSYLVIIVIVPNHNHAGGLHLHFVRVEDVVLERVEGPDVEAEDVGDRHKPNQFRAS